MRIDSSNVGMESARLYKSSSSVRISAGKYVEGDYTNKGYNDLIGDFLQKETPKEDKESDTTTENAGSNDSLSDASNILSTGKLGMAVVYQNNARETFSKLHELCIRRILELLMGHRCNDSRQNISQGFTDVTNPLTSSGYKLVYETRTLEYAYSEEEQTSFAAKGLVKTSDGRELDFNINVSMSRAFSETYESYYEFASLNLVDPLVINLDCNVAQISDQSFFFDLDCDGKEEKISSLGSDSGFLALDINNDGKINDGSELFGTKSGNGFEDLAGYDGDHNGWIDENDDIFNRLKIWTKSPAGEDILYSLKEAGVGAICLASAETVFALTSSDTQNADAIVRRSGAFLYENGTVGTIQQIDLVS